ncbi:uncharacterized protein [Asterias amurensis]|uniref:uncharacterized protein n=1 Tax=Asterias amurensis TaxID=7602 RepID=UPI003AB162B3
MKSVVPFTAAILALVFYDASATETSCTIGSIVKGSIFLPYQQHALIGHTFQNQSGTGRIKCMMLCWRQSRCMSFNHNDISGICQLNDASKEEFPESYKQDDGFSYFGDSSNEAEPLPEETTMTTKTNQESTTTQTQTATPKTTTRAYKETATTQTQSATTTMTTKADQETATTQTQTLTTTMTTKTEQGTPQAQAATTEHITEVPVELSTTPIFDTTSAEAVDTEGPTVYCPEDLFGLTNDSDTPASIWWWTSANDNEVNYYPVTCSDDAEGMAVVSGDLFKAGTTNVTCTAWDAAGNPGHCTFLITVTVCNMTRLGMESGAIADNQINASHVLNDDYANYGPTLARFNGNGSWCGTPYINAWIQVDLGRTVDIYGLIIQGRYQSDEYVRTFYLSYGDDENTLVHMWGDWYAKEYRSEQTTDGYGGLVSVQTASQRMIQSRLIRVTPQDWTGAVCMRFEIISCN